MTATNPTLQPAPRRGRIRDGPAGPSPTVTAPNEILLAFVERIEALEGSRQALSEQIAREYKAARLHDFDKRALKAVLRHRTDPARAAEHRRLVYRYLAALEDVRKEILARDLQRVRARGAQPHSAHDGRAQQIKGQNEPTPATQAAGTLEEQSASLNERIKEARRAGNLYRQIAELKRADE